MKKQYVITAVPRLGGHGALVTLRVFNRVVDARWFAKSVRSIYYRIRIYTLARPESIK
jgi:hypothetical protein